MARNEAKGPKQAEMIPRQKTVLLDNFGIGDRYGHEKIDGGHWCSGKIVSEDVDHQSSFMYIRATQMTQYED